jgi:hypothetical protein
MVKKLRTLILSIASIGALMTPVLIPATVAAADDVIGPALCGGADLSTADKDCKDAGATTRIDSIIKVVINLFSLVVGVVAVIMLIVGGLKYIISAGDSGNVTSAKNTILYAIIGLVVVALAQFIVKFVLNKVSQSG